VSEVAARAHARRRSNKTAHKQVAVWGTSMEAPQKEKEKVKDAEPPLHKRCRSVASFRLVITRATLSQAVEPMPIKPHIICSVGEGQTQSGISTTQRGNEIHFNCTFYFEYEKINPSTCRADLYLFTL